MKKIYAFTGLLIVLLATYIAIWIYSAKWFSQEIDKLYLSSTKDGIEFLGEKPKLSNFPFVPEVIYTQGIKAGNLEVLFPRLMVRGYPIPFMALNLSFPDGVFMGGMVDPQIWNLSLLDINLAVPYRLPMSFYQEDLSAWQSKGGKINVKKYKAQKDELTAIGHGDFSLDENLQPIFNFLSVIDGYEAFIQTEKERGFIDPFGAAIGMTVLNGLSKVDEATGEKTVTLNITVQNQMLSVGPIQALPLPQIVWGKRNLPVLRQ